MYLDIVKTSLRKIDKPVEIKLKLYAKGNSFPRKDIIKARLAGWIHRQKMGVLALTEATALALAQSQVCEFL